MADNQLPKDNYPSEFNSQDREWDEQEQKVFMDKHQELSILLDYPPFSINRGRRDNLRNAIINEETRIQNTGNMSRPFSTLEVEWQDDLDEARLYQKRYNSPKKAQDAAIEMNKLDPEDEENILQLWV